MAGNVTGLHRFADDVGPIPLSLLDSNYDALTQALNTLNTFSNFYVDTGTTNALTITVPSTQNVSYSDGLAISVRVAATNTGAATLNIGTLGPRPIQTAGGAALTGGELQAGSIVDLIYNASRNAFQLKAGGGGGGGGGTSTAPLSVQDSSGQEIFAINQPPLPLYHGVLTVEPGTTQPNGPIALLLGGTNQDVLRISGPTNTATGSWLEKVMFGGTFTSPGVGGGIDFTTNFANGILLTAGTTASDWCIACCNAVNSTIFFSIKGDGSGSLGPYPNQLVWNTSGVFSLTGTASLPGGGGGGASYLSQLLDVSVSAQTNGQVLTWSAASTRWVNQTPITALAGLSDVALTTLAANQVLTYNGVRWVNAAATGGSLATLSDVAISAATAGQFLSYNGSKWVNAPPPTASLAGLSDVTLSGATAGQVLSYNGSRWINSTPSGGGSGGGSPFTAPFYINDTTGGTLFQVTIPTTSSSVPMLQVLPGNAATAGVLVGLAGATNGDVFHVFGANHTTANHWLGEFHSGTAAGFSNGVYIQAGTNASDLAFMVEPVAGVVQYFVIRGDGSGVLGNNGASANNMTFSPNAPFTFTSVSQTVPALVMVTPPKTSPNLWIWELGGGGPSGSSAGCANGLRIAAGTNASDAPLLVRNDADTVTFAQIKGDGSGNIETGAWSATGVWTFGQSTDPSAVQVIVRGPPHTTTGLWSVQIGGGASGASTGCSNGLYLGAGTNAADVALWIQNDAGSADYMKILGDGTVQFPAIGSTTAAANAVLATAGTNSLLLSTSAARYKRDVSTVPRAHARKAVAKLRPVIYRSNCPDDDQRRMHYGLIAEEVAEVDPNLVTFDRDGRPQGVQYERICALLLPLVQEMLGL